MKKFYCVRHWHLTIPDELFPNSIRVKNENSWPAIFIELSPDDVLSLGEKYDIMIQIGQKIKVGSFQADNAIWLDNKHGRFRRS